MAESERPALTVTQWLDCVLVGAAGAMFAWLMIWTSGWAGVASTLLLAFLTITGLCVMSELTSRKR